MSVYDKFVVAVMKDGEFDCFLGDTIFPDDDSAKGVIKAAKQSDKRHGWKYSYQLVPYFIINRLSQKARVPKKQGGKGDWGEILCCNRK